LTDKLLCVRGGIGVVLLVSAQCVVFREYLLQPVQKFWFRLCHMGNEDLLDLFVRQNASFKIRIFDVHNSSL
jgi:hypothetical protein